MTPGRWRRAGSLGVTLIIVGGLLAGCSWFGHSGGSATSTHRPGPERPELADQFVTRSGAQLKLGGQPFRFIGFNYFDAAATDRYTCAWWPRVSDADLDRDFRFLHEQAGATVVRFWAFQTYTQGGTDFSGVDRVIRAARANGMRVMPVLENEWGDCTTAATRTDSKAAYQGDTWFGQGYRVPFGNATLSYRDYVSRIVTHYRDEPTILGWTMMNEAETSARDDQNRPALVGFAGDIAGVIKSADPRHLVSVGSQSNGAPGASGPDFAAVYGLANIDFTEVHDWSAWGSDTEALPGSAKDGSLPATTSPQCAPVRGAPLACSFASAQQLGKPLIVGEAGIAAGDAAGRERRADLLAAKVRAAFHNGASGYLIWQFNHVVDTERYDVLPSDNDPLFAVLRRLSDNPPS
ncbi:cellulase family glycosylhydrolase [Frankia sp. ACN1ag]|uniref:cellulase family glycosylhydrolase n=1 Tax=Frankia sp. ACN1ag TaxID=102891 RepID=UPI000707F901|nr:cellulase family glycosylhydrolase [Frankia sp. ACN1ag]KQC36972.1 hypothetical protein UK82_18495 [Frankia sp. ACN1ag]